MSAAPPLSLPPDSAGIEFNDPLGYHAYAKTLWTRIDHALIRDDANTQLGDDPLVVGLFGEWGVGKSHLLMQIRKLADVNLVEQKKRRAGDPGDTLTIPVWFQAWKYEHEEFMHVPLLLHVMNALKDALHEPPSIAGKVLDAGSKAVTVAEKAAKPVARIAKIASAIFPVVQKILGSVSVFGCKIDVPDEVGEWLESAAEAATSAAEKDKDKTHKGTKELVATGSKDGLYFYRINELLEALTRPGKYEGRKELIAHANVTKETRINFVVFVDDLDRCLPEKAVQVLELIKTVFNVESFAFVLALDDEVIERGIGHRYSAYLLKDKKPHMPITGFEYLEKIVHLPFRLPALTRAQAVAFARLIEERAEPENASRRWFAPTTLAAAGTRMHKASTQVLGKGEPNLIGSGGNAAENLTDEFAAIDLESTHLDLLLAAFDAYVPRKLLRAVELWHQVCRVARERGVSGADAVTGTWIREYAGKPIFLDTRVVFALMLLQLFQPELFRFMRRRDRSFQVLLNAFSQKADGLNKHEVSDVELWSWASYRRGELAIAVDPDPTAVTVAADAAVSKAAFKRPCSELEAVALIASLDSTDAYLAQHVRLRLVERLVEHFAVQRHVFNPLRVMAWLGKHLDLGMVETFVGIDAYFAVLSQHSEQDLLDVQEAQRVLAEKAAAALSVLGFGTATVVLKLPTFAFSKTDALFDVLVAIDTAARSDLQKQFDLPAGRVFDEACAAALHQKFSGHTQKIAPPERSPTWRGFDHAVGAVAAIAPWLGWEQGGKPVLAAVAGAQGSDPTETVIDKLLAQAPTPKSRAAIGDLLERFPQGDPRFDRRRFNLPTARFHSELQDEPIIGFVRIPGSATAFQMGHASVADNPSTPVVIKDTFYIARTLTTVDQYALFAKDGYSAGIEIWGKQGLAWRDGSFDSKVKDKDYKNYLAQRKAELRRAPWNWAAQQAHGSRPVTGVTWFEARAYARWLNVQLKAEIEAAAALKGYGVVLPAEHQWERAARAQSLTAAHTHRWPWGDDEKDASNRANIGTSEIGMVSSVGVFPPNKIGLTDIAGNAWEWMDNIYANPHKSCFAPVLRDRELVTDVDLDKCDLLSLRGGSWGSQPVHASCSCRDWGHPDYWNNVVGFRVVLSLAENEN